MKGWLSRLVGRHEAVAPEPGPSNPEPGESFQQLQELAPVKGLDEGALDEVAETQPIGGAHNTFVCREPILNRQQRVAGYEFMLRKSVSSRLHTATDSVQRIYDLTLLNGLGWVNMGQLLEHRFAWLSINPMSLHEALLERLPARQTVLCISDLYPAALFDESLLARVNALSAAGYRFALDMNQAERLAGHPLLPFLSAVRMDFSRFDAAALSHLFAAIAVHDTRLQLVASGLESFETFELAFRTQFPGQTFDCFQGTFVTSRQSWKPHPVDGGKLRILDLLRQLRQDEELAALAGVIRQDSVLVYKLLRYVNSPAGGLLQKVQSIDHALVVLGRQKLYRWLTVLLFTVGDTDPRDWAVLDTALIRARLMELLGANRFSAAQCEELFLVGLLSLVDIILKLPRDEALLPLSLHGPVLQALQAESGPYAPYLRCVVALEDGENDVLESLAPQIGVDVNTLNRIHLDAAIWTQQLDVEAS